MLKKPRRLPPGAHVAVLAISGPSDLERIEAAADRLRGRGLRVTIASNVGERSHLYLAGEDDRRLAEINKAFADDRYDAFLFARGGYGAMRILDRIDFAAIGRNPRPVIGFSDLTALHQAIAATVGLASFHGPMLNSDFAAGLSPEIDRWFWSMLAGEAPLIHRFEQSQVIAPGRAESIAFGGCLSLTSSLIGTPFDFWIPDGIWFWEDVGESTYQLDRMLTHLKLSGRFERLQGVIVGKLKDCGPEPDQLDWLLHDIFGAMGIPVVRDFPFGHHGDNLLMPIGTRIRLDTLEGAMTIAEPVVS
jgi:muramoyltetrapeptide carboxypeptidase